jgi:glyoxylase-like metal-dependent hydrolase (beta-lactamase superfamily II)
MVNWYALQEDGRWTIFDAGARRYWQQLEHAGIRPEEIEALVFTHAHPDHVGVAERLRGPAHGSSSTRTTGSSRRPASR